MRKVDIDVSEIRQLVELVEKHSLEELSIEDGDLQVIIKGRTSVVHAVESAAAASDMAEVKAFAIADAEESPAPNDPGKDLYGITAPLVGVFYRSPSPDAPPFVEVGDEIDVGSEIGVIEAMKVFSPVPSDVAGIVVEIPAKNGNLVQQGDVLVRVRVNKE